MEPLTAARKLKSSLRNAILATQDGRRSRMIGTQVNEALQSIADAIKGCHRSILFENAKSRGPMSGFRVYIGPPH